MSEQALPNSGSQDQSSDQINTQYKWSRTGRDLSARNARVVSPRSSPKPRSTYKEYRKELNTLHGDINKQRGQLRELRHECQRITTQLHPLTKIQVYPQQKKINEVIISYGFPGDFHTADPLNHARHTCCSYGVENQDISTLLYRMIPSTQNAPFRHEVLNQLNAAVLLHNHGLGPSPECNRGHAYFYTVLLPRGRSCDPLTIQEALHAPYLANVQQYEDRRILQVQVNLHLKDPKYDTDYKNYPSLCDIIPAEHWGVYSASITAQAQWHLATHTTNKQDLPIYLHSMQVYSHDLRSHPQWHADVFNAPLVRTEPEEEHESSTSADTIGPLDPPQRAWYEKTPAEVAAIPLPPPLPTGPHPDDIFGALAAPPPPPPEDPPASNDNPEDILADYDALMAMDHSDSISVLDAFLNS